MLRSSERLSPPHQGHSGGSLPSLLMFNMAKHKEKNKEPINQNIAYISWKMAPTFPLPTHVVGQSFWDFCCLLPTQLSLMGIPKQC